MKIKKRYFIYAFAILFMAILFITGLAEANEFFPYRKQIIYTALIIGVLIEGFEFIAKRNKRVENKKHKILKKAGIDYSTEKTEIGSGHLLSLKRAIIKAAEKRCNSILKNDIISAISENYHALSGNKEARNGSSHIKMPFKYYENVHTYSKARNNKASHEATLAHNNYRPQLKENNVGVIILGEPGNGKTLYSANWLLDELKLLRQAGNEELKQSKIPVFISLGAADYTNFNEDCFDEWIGETFYQQYKEEGFFEPDIAELFKQRELIPFFDGLDEVEESYRFQCFTCLHKYAGKRNSSIFSCRANDFEILLEKYRELEKKEISNIVNIGTIHLQTIENEIKNIIKGRYNDKAMLKFIDANEHLIPYINTPLFFNLFLFCFNKLSEKEQEKIALLAEEDFKTELYNQFETGMYNLKLKHTKIPYKNIKPDEWKQVITNYLITLSHKLGERTALFIEYIQPLWLGEKSRILAYYLVSRIISGFFLSIAVGLLIARYNDFIGNGIVASICAALLTIALNNYEEKRNKLHKAATIFLYTFLLMLVTGLYQGFSIKRSAEDMNGLFSITESLSGIVLGLFYGMIFGFRKDYQTKEKDIRPVEIFDFSFSESLKTGLKGGVLIGVFVTVCALAIKIFGISYTFLSWFQDIVNKYTSIVPNEYLAVIFIAFTVGGFLGFIIFALMGGRKHEASIIEDEKELNKLQTKLQADRTHSLNYGIKRSLRNSFMFGLIVFFIVSALYIGFIQFFTDEFVDPFKRSIAVGAGVAIISCLWFGGFEFIQHWTLRYYLFIYGILPLKINNWVRMVQNLSFLKKIGSGLQFLHPLIQKHYTNKKEIVCDAYLKKSKRLGKLRIAFFVAILILMIWPFITRNIIYWHHPNEIKINATSSGIQKLNDTLAIFKQSGIAKINAHGKIHVGTFTGNVKPSGTKTGFMGFPLSNVYNIDANPKLRHGALLYTFTNKKNDTWHALIDPQKINVKIDTTELLVKKDDTIRFCVNDNEYQNNSGHFYISISFIDSTKKTDERK